MSPEDPCWRKLMELKSIALQWSETAKKVASDSGACGLDQLLRTRSILYCICRKPYDQRPMIACDQCREWYHFACVKLHLVPKIYTCPACKPEEESFCQKPLKNEISTTSGVIEPKTPCARDRLIREDLGVGYSEELVSSIANEKIVYFYGEIDNLWWCNRMHFRTIRKCSDLDNKQVDMGCPQDEEENKPRNFDKSASKSNNPHHIYAPSATSMWPLSRPIDTKNIHHPDVNSTHGFRN